MSDRKARSCSACGTSIRRQPGRWRRCSSAVPSLPPIRSSPAFINWKLRPTPITTLCKRFCAGVFPKDQVAIEFDADIIVFIYRDEYYNPGTTQAKGIAELIVAKSRNGPPGRALVHFEPSCTRFDNLYVGDYPEIEDDP